MLQSKRKHLWKPMRRVSKKQQRSYHLYSKLRREYLNEHPKCELCSLNEANQIHHKKGRGRHLCSVEYFLSVCLDCHSWIHAHPAKARDAGLILLK
jgi:hypothetical protein